MLNNNETTEEADWKRSVNFQCELSKSNLDLKPI